MKSVFLISKPLQYFNATNIPDDNQKIALICNSFEGAANFYAKVKSLSQYWSEVLFFDSNLEGLSWIVKNRENLHNIYIDGDYSFSKRKFLKKLKTKNIFVYEEGLGTYTEKLRTATTKNIKKEFTAFSKIKTKLVTFLYLLMGMKDHHGGSAFTKGIYVYDIEKHKACVAGFRKTRKSFRNSFTDHLKNFTDKSLLYNKDNALLRNSAGKQVVLYLTAWNIDDRITQILSGYNVSFKIAKPHPQINKNKYPLLYNLGFDYISQGGNMVEFLIYDLLQTSSELIVIHHNSAALLYFKGEDKLREVIM